MRRFRITSSACNAAGSEFTVEDDATQEDVEKASFECIAEYVDYGFEEIAENGQSMSL